MSVFSHRIPQSPLSPSSAQPVKKQRPSSVNKDTSSSASASIIDQDIKPYIFEDLRVVCTLGTGSFGTVKLVHHESSGDVMALLCMLLELMQGGELLTHLYDRTDTIPKSSYGGFTTECMQFYLANILLAYEFMHSRDILYRDLKPENILISNDGYIKLADFGFAKLIPYVTSDGDEVTKTYTIVGSPEYMAPEMINQVGYDQSVDYWCLGCLMFELLFAKSLFANSEGLALLTQGNVTRATTASISSSFPDDFKEQHPDMFQLAMSFLVPNPSKRVGFKDIRGSIRASEVFDAQFWSDIEERKVQSVYVPAIEHHLDTSNFFDYDGEMDEEETDHIHDDYDLVFEGDQQIFELF